MLLKKISKVKAPFAYGVPVAPIIKHFMKSTRFLSTLQNIALVYSTGRELVRSAIS